MKEEIVRILKSENGLIGQAVAPILLKELKAVAPVFELATKVDGKGRTIKVPVETVVGNTASWKEEYTAPTVDDVEFRNVEIERQYIQSQINVTRELETDSNIDIALILLKRATKDIATIIARETFLGSGKIKGILNNLTLQETALTATTENKIIIDDLIKLTTAIDIAYWDNAKIFVSLEYFKKLKALKDVNGLQIIKGKKFDEIDIIVCSELDNTEYPVIFANVEKLYCYFTDEELETDTHYNKTKNTSIKILKMAVGGRVVDNKACCLLKK